MSDIKNVRCVLVGLGGYASTYVNHFLDHPDGKRMDLVGLVDPFPQSCKRLEEMTARCDKLYADIADFYRENTADLAIICTPIQFHADHIVTALEHGSHVLCEKPLCADPLDIDRIIAAREKAGRRVYIGYQMSHALPTQAFKADIMKGVFGKPTAFNTMVLAPRDDTYFRRGIGWAGKIRTKDGKPVYDSIAANAAAHYLHNMFYVLGDEVNRSAAPVSVEASLLRANPIENFDTSVIRCTMADGAVLQFCASHTVPDSLGIVYDYLFENGRVLSSSQNIPSELGLERVYTPRHLIAYMNDGTTKDYGDPFGGGNRKLTLMLDAIQGIGPDEELCGVETAAVHTRTIATIQETMTIHDAAPELLRRKDEMTYVEGLKEALIEIFKQGKGDLSAFYKK